MPVDTLDPTWINAPGGVGPSYDSEELRRNQAFTIARGATPGSARAGILAVGDLALSLSGMNVRLGAGGCVVATAKGAYVTGFAATTTVDALQAADVTNPRRDRVVIEILDPDNGGGAGRKGQARVITGTPNASAATGGGYPAEPVLAITLGYVDVPKSGAGNPVLTMTAPITAMAGAPIPVRNATERAALPTWPGLQAVRLDLPGAPTETWDGTKWSVSDTPWITLPLVQGFTHHTGSNWSGLKYRVKGGWFVATGAVSRPSAWPADQAFAVAPAGTKPEIKTAGTTCEVEPTVGNIVMTTSGTAGSLRSVFITWPLP